MGFNIGYAAGGGAAALKDLVAQRFEQAQLEEQMRARQVEEARLADQLKLQKQQEARVKEFQDKQFDDLKSNREDARVKALQENFVPGDPVDPDTKALMEAHGYGGMLRTKQMNGPDAALGLDPSQITGNPTDAQPTTPLSPEGVLTTTARGGTKWLSQRASEQARADNAAANQAAAEERAAADRASREAMAHEGNLTRQTIAGLTIAGANERAATAADAKKSAADAKAAESQKAANDTRSELNRLAQELYDDGSLSSAVGPLDARTWSVMPTTVDFQKRATRLKALLSLEGRSKLKGRELDQRGDVGEQCHIARLRDGRRHLQEGTQTHYRQHVRQRAGHVDRCGWFLTGHAYAHAAQPQDRSDPYANVFGRWRNVEIIDATEEAQQRS